MSHTLSNGIQNLYSDITYRIKIASILGSFQVTFSDISQKWSNSPRFKYNEKIIYAISIKPICKKNGKNV